MDFKYETERIYLEDEQGQLLAEITFPLQDGIATIDHTYVSEKLRGQGVAARLVEAAVKQIKHQGQPFQATCSYAAAWLKRHPEISSQPEA